MRGMFALQHRGEGQTLENSIELLTNAIAKDENYGPSHLGLATAYVLMPDYRRGVTDQTPVQWKCRKKRTNIFSERMIWAQTAIRTCWCMRY